ncbi:uncharacterized protein conserved in bacteria [Longilinea arvoryzae]|uniref:Uncharacterized protein conserved in bacteria n=1 Tax=Longilinea arvoryzae TaxID=360412 RepID=A0A0S7BFY7_9CHLR|nr:acyltransferase [Longilinea arvoryzae]GAP12699.1 uncharacterized protein conserved in bacteria [Longilinea arvoryzae]
MEFANDSAGTKTAFGHLFLKLDPARTWDRNRVAVYDDMRALACLCVVLYHAAGGFHDILNIPAHALDWWAGNVFTGLAVNFLSPIFFILSGAVLLNPARPDESIPKFLRKRARAVLPPFLVASLVYYLYAHAANGSIQVLDFLARTLGEPQYYHLWFFYTLIGLYFLTPILRPIFTPQNRARVEYMLILWVVATAIVPLIQRFSPIRIAIFPSAFVDFTGYFLFGGYFFNLRRWNLKKPWALCIAVLMTLVTLFGTGSLSLAQGKYDGFFSNQVGLNVILATLCLTSLFSDDPLAGLRDRSPLFAGLVQVISRQSLWIYVFHPLVNELLPFGLPFLRGDALNPLLRIPLTALCSVTLITLASEGLHRVKAALSIRLRDLTSRPTAVPPKF